MIFKSIDPKSDQYQTTLKLRQRILRHPLGLTLNEADTEDDHNQLHFIIQMQDAIIACVVMKPLNNTKLKLRQMAVDEAYQKQGVGKLLITRTESAVKKLGYSHIELAARKNAVGFYRALGYETQGEYFNERTIEHILMTKLI